MPVHHPPARDRHVQSKCKYWFYYAVTTSRGKQRALRELNAFPTFQTMEPVDQLLQCVDPARDRELWVRENKTGETRPVDIEI